MPPFLRAKNIRAQGRTIPRFTLKLGTSVMTVVRSGLGLPMVTYGPGDASLDQHGQKSASCSPTTAGLSAVLPCATCWWPCER